MDGTRLRALLLAAAVLLGSASGVGAFTFDPMVVSFDSAGPGSVRSFRLKNDEKKQIAVRVQVLSRETLEDGTERNEPVPEGLFVVYPSRFILEPGSTRNLKVQWRGGDPGPKELPFRIVAEQVPVNFEERKGSGLNFMFRFVGAAYILPPKPLPAAVSVLSATGSEKDGIRGIELRLRNAGGVHSILSEFKMSLSSSSGEVTRLPDSALSNVEGNNLLPDAERLFFVPFENAEVGVPYDARIDYKPDN